MRPTWNWLLAATLAYITWEHCDTQPHAHIHRHTQLGLIVLAVQFPTYSWVHVHRLELAKMRRRPINPFDSYLFVCLTLPGCHLFSFISFAPSYCCVCVCPSIRSLSRFEMLPDTVTPVCTLELVSYEQSLTWNAILETHTLSDSSKNLFAVVLSCNGRWGEAIQVADIMLSHEETLV